MNAAPDARSPDPGEGARDEPGAFRGRGLGWPSRGLGGARGGGTADARGPALRARAPGSRHRLLPAAAGHALVRASTTTTPRSRPARTSTSTSCAREARASKPSARILDTGEELKVETLKGEEIRRRAIDIGEPIVPDARGRRGPFPAGRKGHSVRLRISETYTDPKSYRLDGDELVFDRASAGRATPSCCPRAGT